MDQGLAAGIAMALVIAALAGLSTGVGVGVFRVHPLIMTLGMSLVVLGLANAGRSSWSSRLGRAPRACARSGPARSCGLIPYSFLVFVPLAG